MVLRPRASPSFPSVRHSPHIPPSLKFTYPKDCDGNLKYSYANVDFTPLTIGGGSYGMFLGTNVAGAMVSLVCWALFAKLDFCLFNEIPTLAEVNAAAAAKVKIYVADDQGAVSLIDAPGPAGESPASPGEIELLVTGSHL